jgi:hypothetical protein
LDKAAPPPKPPLPSKVTVRLTKQTLDRHKAGTMNQAELRSAAEVEAIGFSKAANPKP